MATKKTPGPARVAPPTPDEIKMFADSMRRCAFCFGLHKDDMIKAGQIAHVDRNRSNSKYKNLAWLCLVHHDEYDSSTSQSKGLTTKELLHYRAELYAHNAALPTRTQAAQAAAQISAIPTPLVVPTLPPPVAPVAAPLSQAEIGQIRAFLMLHKSFFEYVFHEREHLAFALRSDAQDTLAELRLSWGDWHAYDKRVRAVQARLREAIQAIYVSFDPQSYDLHGGYIKFDKKSTPYGTFEKKREALKPLITQLEVVYKELDELATE